MERRTTFGHMAAIVTILIWGTTFISTKVLLEAFTPMEILFFRFSMGFIVLYLAKPGRLRLSEKKQELLFALAGLTGVTLYFLLENIALTYSPASNVGVIISISPFITALLAQRFLEGERLTFWFFAGFAAAITGIFLISFNGAANLNLNPRGDLLAILAAVFWSLYSILSRKISSFGYNTIMVTRKIFSYGLLFMLPPLCFMDFHWQLQRFTQPVLLFNILFLGLGASALCFVTWNHAVKVLGAVKTSAYIYAVPVITVVTSIIILRENVTHMAALGTVLTLAGLVISEGKHPKKAGKNETQDTISGTLIEPTYVETSFDYTNQEASNEHG